MLTGELPIGRFAPPSKKVHFDVRLDEVVLRALEKEPELRYQKASEVKTEVERIQTSPRLAELKNVPASRVGSGVRGKTKSSVMLVTKLAVWTGVLITAGLYLSSRIWLDWWPTRYNEQFAVGFEPQSGAYSKVRLQSDRRLLCWGQHPDRPITKGAWTAAATIDVPQSTDSITLQFDAFLEQWRWSPPVKQATVTQDELDPNFVAEWMHSAGVDVGRPGVVEEIEELLRLVKDAANGVAPGGGSPRAAGLPDGTRLGRFTSDGISSWGVFWKGPVIVFRVVAAGIFLAVWLPGVVMIVRRHRHRMSVVREFHPLDPRGRPSSSVDVG